MLNRSAGMVRQLMDLLSQNDENEATVQVVLHQVLDNGYFKLKKIKFLNILIIVYIKIYVYVFIQ
jgi:hypothetical protein